PQYRELGAGDVGDDVAALHAYLAQVAGADLDGPRYTARTERAVRAYQKSVGADPDGRFRPGLVVYLSAGLQIDVAGRTQEGEAVEAQSVVVEGDARPGAVRVEGAEGAAVEALALESPVVVSRAGASLTLGPGDWGEQDVAALFD